MNTNEKNKLMSIVRDLESISITSESISRMRISASIEVLNTMIDNESKNVISPNHYSSENGVECIDIIKYLIPYMSPSQAFPFSQVVKYVYRAPYKNGVEDIQKARYYMKEFFRAKPGRYSFKTRFVDVNKVGLGIDDMLRNISTNYTSNKGMRVEVFLLFLVMFRSANKNNFIIMETPGEFNKYRWSAEDICHEIIDKIIVMEEVVYGKNS